MAEAKELTVSTEEDAFALLELALDGEFEDEILDLSVEGDWSQFVVKVTGEDYHASLNGKLVKTLADLQTQLNRLYADALGKSAKGLSNDEREEIELIFQVSEGSTEVSVDLGDWATTLAKTAMADMTGTQITVLAIGLVIVLAASKAGTQYHQRRMAEIDRQRAADERQAEAQRHEQIIQQISEQNETVRKAVHELSQFQHNVLRSAPTADQVVIAGQEFSREDIEEASRTERRSADLERLDGDYYISAITHKEGGFNVSLEDLNGVAFRAELTKGRIEQEDLDRLWSALRDGMPVGLQVAARVHDDGAIFSAHIIGMKGQEEA